MSVANVENFNSFLLASEQELAQDVTTSLLKNGSYVINIYFLIYLLFLSGNITQKHLFASIFLVSSLFLAIKLINNYRSNSPIIINQIALLMLPIYVDDSITKPWVSYGLLCAIFVLFASAIDSNSIFAAVVVITPLLQYFVANLNLKGIIDNQDLLYLNSFFSTTWIIVAGFGVRIARSSYYKYCAQIDEQLFALQDRLLEESKLQTQLNLKDYKNISIHGTLLNTLISYSNTSDLNQKRAQMAQDLANDILTIDSAQQSSTKNASFIKILQSNLAQYQIRLDLKIDPSLILDSQIVESTLEIIREVVLNTKKHTDSQILEINLDDDSSKVQVTIKEIFNQPLSSAQMDAKLLAANSSNTLQRLISQGDIDLKISGGPARSTMIYDIRIAKPTKPGDVLKKIEKIRSTSLIRNVQLLTLVSVFYSYLAIIGFLIDSIPGYVILILITSSALLSYELLRSRKSTWRPVVSQLLVMTLIPFVISTNEACQNLLYTPWLFNAIFGSVLYGIAVVKNPILKWSPALIFIAENTLTRWSFPESCKTLLDGSTPGFIFILIFGFLMAKLRTRNTKLDRGLESSLQSQIERSKHIADLVDLKRNYLIEELKLFAKNLTSNALTDKQLKDKTSQLIQKIRVFLICSEHFSSNLIQALFEFANKRIDSGSPVRISIYVSQLSDNYSFDISQLDELSISSQGKNIDIVISETEKLELEFLVEGQSKATFKLTN